MSLSKHDKIILNVLFNPGASIHSLETEDNYVDDGDDIGEENEEVKELELNAIDAADKNKLDESIDLFSQAIIKAPLRASCYNNRAQVLRLKGDLEGAKADLDKAISLSSRHRKAASQAYTQRAIIKRYEGLEDEAMADFQQAAKLGGSYAKEMSIALNPYAALCSNMLAGVFQKVCEGQAIE